MKLENVKKEIKKIDSHIHKNDVLGLGGSPGEYSNVVFKLYKEASVSQGIITEQQIKEVFKNQFGELAERLVLRDLQELRSVIQDALK